MENIASRRKQRWLRVLLYCLGILILLGCFTSYLLVNYLDDTLWLPAARDISHVEFGFNEDLSHATWYPLSQSCGLEFVDVFRDSLVNPPQTPYDRCTTLPNQYEYSLHIVDRKQRRYAFVFNTDPGEIYIREDWAGEGFYLLPKERIAELKRLVSRCLKKQSHLL